MKHNFEERRNNRINYAHQRAAKSEAEADRLYNVSNDMASFIPLGQPILIGHHSEKRDRRYRERMRNVFGQSVAQRDKAAYYGEKAESIEHNNAIFSDDPDALEKLTEKLKTLQELQEFMKAANKCIKKNDKTAFLKLNRATEPLWEKLTTPDYANRTGFPSYKLTNNNANIRRIADRIAGLKKLEKKQAVDKTVNGVRIYENKDANRLQLIFKGKPYEDIRKQLKSSGFHWSPSEGAWQRHISPNALYSAESIVRNFKDIA
ncbi:DUF3560 domain-containing protein [Mucilaginibacter paludis]|uniref:DUF3560 domain-containing protein n=1 Tax=Mucilaginibacter paludis DSM 18603 TaxID=714943 RepID=H1YHX6_9SPHI|nr:DUF3560 domain-containing protein [Mucilaginibacter paludis]EHQ25524.1 hypothetical protein Mucpa_1362 [Mucilaginibacter paludis DSM 18603]